MRHARGEDRDVGVLLLEAICFSLLEAYRSPLEMKETKNPRIGKAHLDVGVLLLEVLSAAGDGAAGAHPADENVDLALRCLPDLRPGGPVVHLGEEGREGGSAGEEAYITGTHNTGREEGQRGRRYR